MSEIITTGEALDRLPLGSVVQDSSGGLWLLDGERWVSPETKPVWSDRLINRYGPVTVLYNPDSERNRLEAAEAEIERLRCLVEAEDLHAALAPGETCDVCAHLEAENLAEQCMAEMDRADAAEAKLAEVKRIHGWMERYEGGRKLGSFCTDCGTTYPCDTRRAAEGVQP